MFIVSSNLSQYPSHLWWIHWSISSSLWCSSWFCCSSSKEAYVAIFKFSLIFYDLMQKSEKSSLSLVWLFIIMYFFSIYMRNVLPDYNLFLNCAAANDKKIEKICKSTNVLHKLYWNIINNIPDCYSASLFKILFYYLCIVY